jgi:vacuolar-type H+-ATPase subunit H
MKPNRLKAAIMEAKRFLEKASQAQELTWEDMYSKKHTEIKQGKTCSAIKRSSLDLSRALIELRNDNW